MKCKSPLPVQVHTSVDDRLRSLPHHTTSQKNVQLQSQLLYKLVGLSNRRLNQNTSHILYNYCTFFIKSHVAYADSAITHP